MGKRVEEFNMSERSILNCGQKVRFEFQCDQRWDELEGDSDHPRRRFCEQCKKNVFLCVNVEEAALRIEQGECIAVDARVAEHVEHSIEPGRIIVGQGVQARLVLKTAWEHTHENG